MDVRLATQGRRMACAAAIPLGLAALGTLWEYIDVESVPPRARRRRHAHRALGDGGPGADAARIVRRYGMRRDGVLPTAHSPCAADLPRDTMNRQPLRRVAVDVALLWRSPSSRPRAHGPNRHVARARRRHRPPPTRPIVNPAAQPQRPSEVGIHRRHAPGQGRHHVGQLAADPGRGRDGARSPTAIASCTRQGSRPRCSRARGPTAWSRQGTSSAHVSLVTADVKSRPFVVTDKQLLEWVDRRAKSGIR